MVDDRQGGDDRGAVGDGAATDGGYHFQIVGPFEVWRAGTRVADRELGSRKGRTLLKVLLVQAGELVTRDQLTSILWPEATTGDPSRNLASLISRLRRTLGPEVIEAVGDAYRLVTGRHAVVDLREGERLAAEARAHLDVGAHALAWTAADRALTLLGDRELLAGESASSWADDARSALTVLRRDLRRCGWEAALALGDLASAQDLAVAALAVDPLDEPACRAVMRTGQLQGDVAVGLRAFEGLRNALAEELGIEPSRQTQELHLALLRDEDGPVEPADAVVPEGRGSEEVPAGRVLPAGRPTSSRYALVGRADHLGVLGTAWERAAVGRANGVVITGEAGIGKTRLADTACAAAESSGGDVLRVRCFEAERSLFLGPVVEVLADLARRTPPHRLRELAQPWEGTLGDLVPEIREALGPIPYAPAGPRLERRRVFEAVSALLRAASRDQPRVLLLDDLHLAGSSTIELLHYLLRHASGARLLVIATVRVEEGGTLLRDLGEVAQRLDVGPLTDAAILELARVGGAAHLANRIVASTRGHTLSVVETLQAIAEVGAVRDGEVAAEHPSTADAPPLPASLRSAVLDRVARAGPEVAELLRGAAVLGTTFEVPTLADLLELPAGEVVQRVERAMAARLLVDEGDLVAFGNDLLREIVYADTPGPTLVLRHRRAARLLAGRPEAVATHATAAGDHAQALEAWLDAADAAAARYANRDAESLLGRAIDAGAQADDLAGVARARLARGHVRETLAEYPDAFADLEAAADLARASARPDLEAAALRALGGDVIVGLGRPSTDCLPYLEAGLHVAQDARLGRDEVELLARIAVVWSNRARFDLAVDHAERAMDRAQDLDDDRARALALDAVKNVSFYLGDLGRLEQVLPELERLLRAQDDLTLLQWAVFESCVIDLARANWVRAEATLDRALAINRRTGYPWGSLFLAHRSWCRRARGDYGAAIDAAREAGRAGTSADHPWWVSFANAMLGWVLSDVGAQEAAVGCLDRGAQVAERDGMETYLLRCLAHLALARARAGDDAAARSARDHALGLLAGITVPSGHAFLHGAHAVAALARTHLALGEPDAAIRLLDPLRAPAEAVGWVEVVATDRILRGRGSLDGGDVEVARVLLEEGLDLADRSGLRPLAAEAHGVLADVAAITEDVVASDAHRRSASTLHEVIAGSIAEPALRARYLEVAGPR